MKRILAALFATTGLTSVSSAADFVEPMQVVAPLPVERGWTGFYVGGHVGYGSGESQILNRNNNESNNPLVRGSDIASDAGNTGGGVDADEEDLLYIIDYCRGTPGTAAGDACEDLGLEFHESEGEYEPAGGGPFLDLDADVEGVHGGGQLGYDVQFNRFLLGVIADASVSGITGTGTFYQDDDSASDHECEDVGGQDNNLCYEPTTQNNFRVEYDWLATLRGRVGFLPTSNWLLYAHGGFAAAQLSVFSVGTIGPYTDSNTTDIATGWIAGVGTEVRLNDHHSFFAEYSFADLGDIDLEHKEAQGRADLGADDNEIHLVKVGYNWRPDWMFGP